MRILEEKDYEKWFYSLTIKEQTQIMKRLNRIKQSGELGDSKNLSEGLFELRWKNGWRIYFVRIKDGMILLLGGLKNDQKKDIKKARIILQRYTNY